MPAPMNPYLPLAIPAGFPHRLLVDAGKEDWLRLEAFLKTADGGVQVRDSVGRPPYTGQWDWQPVQALTVACRTEALLIRAWRLFHRVQAVAA